jgi:Holliday junction resolvase RusA-like endonuclease
LPKFTFTVPSIPGREHSPNARLHWGDRSRAKKQMKLDWFYAIAEARGSQRIYNNPLFDGPVSMTVSIYYPKGRKFADKDNVVASIKAGIDATEDAGLVINDAQIDAPVIVQLRTEGKDGYTVVEMEG